MRVLQLTQRFPPAIGGVENHVLNLASKLTESGLRVDVFASDSMRDVPFRRLEGETSKFPFTLRRFHAIKLAAMPHGLGIVAPAMIPGAFSQSTDLIHAHAYGYFPTYVGALARRIRKVPLVITPHSNTGRSRAAKRIFDILVPTLTLRQAQRIIALTESEAEYLTVLGIPRQQIVVIPNGVNLAEFANIRPKTIRDNDATIIFVGRLYPKQKGLEVLIQALSHIPRSVKFRLDLVGEDWGAVSGLLQLARQIGVDDRVVVRGSSGRDSLLHSYASADLLVLPSLFEAFGIVLLEAMAAGLPVVASNVGGIPEVVEDGKTGLLVKPGDSERLGAAIEKLLSDDSLRKAMSDAGRKRASLFSWDLLVPKIKRVYEEVIAEKAN